VGSHTPHLFLAYARDNPPDDEAVQQFRHAADADEYAEVLLPTGDYLTTDWEGDGTFNPYVFPRNSPHDDEDAAERIGDAIAEVFGVRVDTVEWDGSNMVYVPYMDRVYGDVPPSIINSIMEGYHEASNDEEREAVEQLHGMIVNNPELAEKLVDSENVLDV
jgi:hypothetical protein